jgi:hypothetical protein
VTVGPWSVILGCSADGTPIRSRLRFVLVLSGCDPHLSERMDIVKEREIIKLWNRLRLLECEGRPTTAVRRQIEKALEHAA